ncbi:MAG: hypothetical protein PHS32_08015 [Rhodoferax sp.]|uniref:hypothetical protein n=1 Tax=Rhodoferax sp. TaxID=50421 RepID=UPI00260B6BC7|nr:hypothetical protein [Rhodoferax sp.]MDD5333676.1 hypothetical protein [Rhodoferax sp.]
MKRLLCGLALCLALAACMGVPLRSLPRLMQLPKELLDANPAELMVALQVDARMTPPVGAVPLLNIKLAPREPGQFEAIDKQLPMQVSVAAAATLGLDAPGAGRRWLLYSLPASTQLELVRIQGIMQRARTEAQGKGGGTISVGVTQASLATTDPALADTRWETWLQTRRRDGFFEVWSGTPAQLQKSAGGKP